MERKDGGSAFPAPVAVGSAGDVYDAAPGMTLRDWFAGQVLVGVLASNPFYIPGAESEFTLARICYGVADALIAQRVKPTP